MALNKGDYRKQLVYQSNMNFIIYYNLNFLTLSNFATNMGLGKLKIPYLNFSSSYLFVTTGTMDGGHNNITWLLKN